MNDHEQQPAEQVVERGFTARLEQLRSHAGHPTLETIARKSGRSIGAVSNTFTGKAVPSNATAERIVTALGSPFDDEWRRLLDEARSERDGKSKGKADSAETPPSSGERPRRRTVLIAGIAGLAVLGGAAVAFLPDWTGSEADHAGSGDVRPVVVTQAGPLGLIVRSSGTRDGEQIGSAAEGQTLWAECRAVTDFDPRPDTGKGPVWYRVRWPGSGPTKDFLNSTPQDEYSGWVYGGFAAPREAEEAPVPQC